MRRITFAIAVSTAIACLDARPLFAQESESSESAESLAAKTKELLASLRAAAAVNDIEGAARYALLLNAMTNAQLPKEKRRYVRAPYVEAACDRYDRKNGFGSCAVLALKTTGEATLVDRSAGKPQKILSDAEVARTNREAVPLLQDCIQTAVKEDPDRFDTGSVELSWGIDRNGRVIEIEVGPRRMKAAVGDCIEERLSWFRYPQSESQELKFVSLSFELTAVVHTELVSTP